MRIYYIMAVKKWLCLITLSRGVASEAIVIIGTIISPWILKLENIKIGLK